MDKDYVALRWLSNIVKDPDEWTTGDERMTVPYAYI